MQQLPIYVSMLFILTTILTMGIFYFAANKSKKVLFISVIWLIIQLTISLTGFYTITNTLPPRFILLIGPPLILIAILFITKSGRKFLDTFQLKLLTYLHIIRIPVETTLFLLFLNNLLPELMTFEGRNPDILSGITAPIVAFIVFRKKPISKTFLLVWNFVCLVLLLNIVGHAVLSTPTTFQKLAFDQPNVAILYFPFVWLPSFLVPLVLLSHLTSIRKIIIDIRAKKRAVV